MSDTVRGPVGDPLDVLRSGPTPADPDPRFAAALRARLRAVLMTDRPEGDTVTDIPPVTAGSPSVSPYLTVDDGRRALDWYVDVLGARLRGQPQWEPDGRLGHAELDVGAGVIRVADEWPEYGLRSPRSLGGTSVSLLVYVADVDAAAARAVAGGGTLERPAQEAYGDRRAVVHDPFGHRWLLSSPVAAPQAPPRPGRHGDVGYVTLEVPDVRLAEAFYGAVLGWRCVPGSVPEGRQVVGVQPDLGLWGGAGTAAGVLCYQVDDAVAAAQRVRDAGGTAAAAEPKPYGTLVECTDDQGTRFQLWQP